MRFIISRGTRGVGIGGRGTRRVGGTITDTITTASASTSAATAATRFVFLLVLVFLCRFARFLVALRIFRMLLRFLFTLLVALTLGFFRFGFLLLFQLFSEVLVISSPRQLRFTLFIQLFTICRHLSFSIGTTNTADRIESSRMLCTKLIQRHALLATRKFQESSDIGGFPRRRMFYGGIILLNGWTRITTKIEIVIGH